MKAHRRDEVIDLCKAISCERRERGRAFEKTRAYDCKWSLVKPSIRRRSRVCTVKESYFVCLMFQNSCAPVLASTACHDLGFDGQCLRNGVVLILFPSNVYNKETRRRIKHFWMTFWPLFLKMEIEKSLQFTSVKTNSILESSLERVSCYTPDLVSVLAN